MARKKKKKKKHGAEVEHRLISRPPRQVNGIKRNKMKSPKSRTEYPRHSENSKQNLKILLDKSFANLQEPQMKSRRVPGEKHITQDERLATDFSSETNTTPR